MAPDDVPTDPVLVACAHGTRGPRGRQVVGSLVAAVAAARPGLQVEAAFVDVQPPRVADVVRRVTERGRRAVVVPLLLSGGYHVHVDVARAVGAPGARAAGPLGPDERLTAVLLDRLHAAGATTSHSVVVAAAGSSDARSRADVERVAELLRGCWRGMVGVGYGASAEPSVADAVAQARAQRPGSPVAIAAYLLAPGFFLDRLHAVGADLVSGPLAVIDQQVDSHAVSRAGSDAAPRAGSEAASHAVSRVEPRVVQIVLDRYDAAVAVGVTASSPPAPAR